MKLSRTELLTATGPLVLKRHAREPCLEGMDLPSGTFKVELQVTQAGEDIDVKGRVLLTARETCDRCLDPFDDHMDVTFQLIVTERESLLGRDQASDIYLLSSGQQELDLAPAIRDAIHLERSMKRICSEECRGLCPRCGVNLNVEDCRCEEDVIDERWAVLKEISLSRTE